MKKSDSNQLSLATAPILGQPPSLQYSKNSENKAPLIAHIIFRLGVGGLENGLVNLINQTPSHRYRHCIICVKDATDFRDRIHRSDVEVFTLDKKEGLDWMMFLKLYRLLQEIQPTIVHTRNLATIECQLPVFLSGVRYRLHGEHGWDVFDPQGENKKYQWLRRVFKPLVKHYIPLSKELERYLRYKIKVPENKITRICNGVDTEIFYPPKQGREIIPDCPFTDKTHVIVGTVGRMHGVKDQLTLVKAFIHLIEQDPSIKDRLRLILVGDGPLREQAQEMLDMANLGAFAWLSGERNDIPQILRGMDLFVLPSLAEGVSNTILEAMATGLPVIATDVGGNPDLISEGDTGFLVPKADPIKMAKAITRYLENSQLIEQHGGNGLKRIQNGFSLSSMVNRYLTVYDYVSK